MGLVSMIFCPPVGIVPAFSPFTMSWDYDGVVRLCRHSGLACEVAACILEWSITSLHMQRQSHFWISWSATETLVGTCESDSVTLFGPRVSNSVTLFGGCPSFFSLCRHDSVIGQGGVL